MPTNINGTTGIDQIQDGTVTEAKLADGAVTAAKLAPGVISTDSVLAATAGLTVGAVGTYAFLGSTSSTLDSRTEGFTVSGSILRYSNASGTPAGGIPSGTWRLIGATSTTTGSKSTLYLRIS
jgi:hypothetical protein